MLIYQKVFFVKDYHAVLFLMIYVRHMDENRCCLVEIMREFSIILYDMERCFAVKEA